MYRLRRIHLAMLVVVLVVAVVLVAVRGVNARGIGLITVVAILVAFRWWQLRTMQHKSPH